mmetsp:Transcript_345/g.1276  ORF Transcript_345/g.1276 Transcript_345/m.1276 type:complete len:726 (-) Transcript_345:91-2268(-)|eukprot:CAMPEP_0117440050 /NCGR_PEP_ID=MMETSP0759-20121206/2877_1 /TAXON_ID=63605 /ORGANISM="Percolomonas cosmopolitus, Strain WS" /LENGTH=725 /DNA_ID=CAMNT_0005231777 /DNA_START=283 /DNA_END=2460 /DNA_ORIENTATION=+
MDKSASPSRIATSFSSNLHRSPLRSVTFDKTTTHHSAGVHSSTSSQNGPPAHSSHFPSVITSRSSPPTKPFPHKTLHTYTPNATTPIPYPTKPPSYLHTLLPHILPPLLALYPDPERPPKTQIALHLYTLVSQYGDKIGFQKSEKDLMWYDVLCCIEASMKQSGDDPTGDAANKSNEFQVIWNAFNGKNPLFDRNKEFMHWAVEYMRQHEIASTNAKRSVISPPRSSVGNKETQGGPNLRHSTPPTSTKYAGPSMERARAAAASPSRTRVSAASVSRVVPDLLKEETEKKSKRRFRSNSADDDSPPLPQGTRPRPGASPSQRRSAQEARSTDSPSTSTSSSQFPLEDYAKQISDRVLQKRIDRVMKRLQQKQSDSVGAAHVPPPCSEDDQSSSDSASHYSEVSTSTHRHQTSSPSSLRDQDLKSRRNINVAPLYVTSGDASRQTTTSAPNSASNRLRTNNVPQATTERNSAHTPTSASTPLSSSSFVRLFTQQQQKITSAPVPTVRSSADPAGEFVSNLKSPRSQSSPDKSLILESYLKASGDDILETASSFIDKFYDDIVSPVSKERSVLSRKTSSSSILSARSIRRRDMFKDGESAKPLDFEQSRAKGQDTVLEGQPQKMAREDVLPANSDATEDAAEDAVITPTNTALTETLSPLPDAPPKSPSSPSHSEISHSTFENMVHEYWTNYKSIMKTAKWKAEVIDLIAETRAEYELEMRHRQKGR